MCRPRSDNPVHSKDHTVSFLGCKWGQRSSSILASPSVLLLPTVALIYVKILVDRFWDNPIGNNHRVYVKSGQHFCQFDCSVTAADHHFTLILILTHLSSLLDFVLWFCVLIKRLCSGHLIVYFGHMILSPRHMTAPRLAGTSSPVSGQRPSPGLSLIHDLWPLIP